MRHIPIILLLVLGAALAGGCSGYDRRLLGDPQPAPPAPVANADTHPDANPDADEGTYAEPTDMDMFSDLAFYGTWYRADPYGEVWRPFAPVDWCPFTAGQWAWTEYGWLWVSYEPFGWATYHYGFWAYDVVYGWVWIPGYDWSPCQVNWFVNDDYICWSPIPPPGHRFKDPWDTGGVDPWVGVKWKHFADEDIAQYKVPMKFKAGYSDRSLRRAAPEVRDVERIRGRSLEPVGVVIGREKVGQHELTRVTLPPAQQRIVDQHKTRMKNPKQTPAQPAKASDSSVQSKSDPERAKVTPPKQKSSDPMPYKEKAREDKSKNDKSKDGSDKGDSKGGGKAKAKG